MRIMYVSYFKKLNNVAERISFSTSKKHIWFISVGNFLKCTYKNGYVSAFKKNEPNYSYCSTACCFHLKIIFYRHDYVFLLPRLTWIPAHRIRCCGGSRQIHTDYRNPVEKKGWHGRSLSERGQERELTPAWTGFYCFSGNVT